jgi:hypothetical protein
VVVYPLQLTKIMVMIEGEPFAVDTARVCGSAATSTADPRGGLPSVHPRGRAWVAPVLAATAIFGVTVAVLVASVGDAHRPAPRTGNGTTTGSILGSWRLVAATGGHAIPVPTKLAVLITFQGDDTAVIWTGVNAINLTVRYEPGAITARFHGTTAAYDGNTDPNYLAVLGLLDALAPIAGTAPAVRCTYRIQHDRLTIRVSTGTLEFTRDPAGGQPVGTASASPSPAAPTVVEPS